MAILEEVIFRTLELLVVFLLTVQMVVACTMRVLFVISGFVGLMVFEAPVLVVRHLLTRERGNTSLDGDTVRGQNGNSTDAAGETDINGEDLSWLEPFRRKQQISSRGWEHWAPRRPSITSLCHRTVYADEVHISYIDPPPEDI